MADTLDIVTLAEAKTALSIESTNTTQDTTLATVITTVSRKFDRAIGPTVQRSITSERHDGGQWWIELAWGPVSAVSAVTEYQGTTAVLLTNETVGTNPNDGFYAEPYDPDPSLLSGVIVRRVSGWDSAFYRGRGNVTVGYLAGRSIATTAVDARIKEAALITIRNVWRSYEQSIGGVDEYDVPSQSFPGFAIPNAAQQLVSELLRPEVGFGG